MPIVNITVTGEVIVQLIAFHITQGAALCGRLLLLAYCRALVGLLPRCSAVVGLPRVGMALAGRPVFNWCPAPKLLGIADEGLNYTAK